MKIFFKPINGKYFTGETREEICKKLKIQNSNDELTEANIQLYLAFRYLYLTQSQEAQKIKTEALKQYNELFSKSEKQKNIQELKNNIIQTAKAPVQGLIQTGNVILNLSKHLHLVLISVAIIIVTVLFKKFKQ